MASILGHMVALRPWTAQTASLVLQTLTTILQQLVRRAPPDSSLVQPQMSVRHVHQGRLTWTATQQHLAILVRVVATRHKDRLCAITARAEQQIPTPRRALNAFRAAVAPTQQQDRYPAIPVMLVRPTLILILLHRAYGAMQAIMHHLRQTCVRTAHLDITIPMAIQRHHVMEKRVLVLQDHTRL